MNKKTDNIYNQSYNNYNPPFKKLYNNLRSPSSIKRYVPELEKLAKHADIIISDSVVNGPNCIFRVDKVTVRRFKNQTDWFTRLFGLDKASEKCHVAFGNRNVADVAKKLMLRMGFDIPTYL